MIETSNANRRWYLFADEPTAGSIVLSCRNRRIIINKVPSHIDLIDLAFIGQPFAFVVQRTFGGKDLLLSIEKLRVRGDGYPIIVISTIDSDEGLIEALAAGANDYVNLCRDGLEVLTARLLAIEQRFQEHIGADYSKAGPFSYDRRSAMIWCGKSRLQILRRETQFLSILMQYAGRLITKKFLYSEVFGTLEIYRVAKVDSFLNNIEFEIQRIAGESLLTVENIAARLGPKIEASEFLNAMMQPVPAFAITGDASSDLLKINRSKVAKPTSNRRSWDVATSTRRQMSEDRAAMLAPVIEKLQEDGITTTHALARELTKLGVLTVTGRSNWHPQQVSKILQKNGFVRSIKDNDPEDT